ncbi:conserved exported hypothetical protein [Candidatus Sulfopaludibacter sp. SbA3]|nr:conserved exported hypothetical protein [Candidatus Sulfopaludibacter sp. SbA3]
MIRLTRRGTVLKGTAASSLLLLAVCVTNAQTANKGLTFDAASIKPAAMPAPGKAVMAAPSGGPDTRDPSRIHYPFITLKALLLNAYDVKPYQIQGPPWLDTERFDVNATMPPETTKEQFRAMLQNLLAERFKLTIHRETKQLPVYLLVVGKNGPNMRESNPASPAGDEANPASPASFAAPKIGPDGFPALPSPAAGRPGLFLMMMPGRARLVGQQQTMLDLANRLTGLLSQPVTDETGLAAKYDFTLTFSPDGMSAPMGAPSGPVGMMVPATPPAPSGAAGGAVSGSPLEGDSFPDVFRAVKEQLGLALEAKKGPVELIVLDHIEKTPADN